MLHFEQVPCACHSRSAAPATASRCACPASSRIYGYKELKGGNTLPLAYAFSTRTGGQSRLICMLNACAVRFIVNSHTGCALIIDIFYVARTNIEKRCIAKGGTL